MDWLIDFKVQAENLT